MKKLALVSVVVAIALVGFIAVLYCLPGKDCCGDRTKCEIKAGDHDAKCGDHHGSCKSGEGKENCTVKEWKDADGKMHKEVKVIVNGNDEMNGMGGCQMHDKMPMGCGGNQMMGGCCCCCRMMMNGCGMNGDSAQTDSVRVKIRGKL